MIDAAFCIPGDIRLPTGGYRYDRELLARMPAHGVNIRLMPLPAGFPHPSAFEIDAARAALESAGPTDALLIDGLALGAMPPELIRAQTLPVVALVHHPLCLESGLSPARAAALRHNEADALRHCAQILVTSAATSRWLVDEFALPAEAITVAEPGVDRPPRARGTGAPIEILAVGAVSDRKAYPLLIEALAASSDVDWRLTVAGSLTLSPEAVARLREAVAASGLAERVALTGAIEDCALAGLYDRADLFVSASLHEGYGMAIAEALAHGLPIVASTGGAAGDLLPEAAALKVPPGDAAALGVALRRAMTDVPLRRDLADSAWAAAASLPRWDDAARIVAGVLTVVAASRRPS